MSVDTRTIQFETNGNGQMVDITGAVSEIVNKAGIGSGIVTVFVPGATGGLTTVEYEPGLVEDVQEMFERVAPRDLEYHHNLRWQDGNGHSHVRATLLGPSLVIPFSEGKLLLGVWQQIVFIDFDNRSRCRELICQLMGE